MGMVIDWVSITHHYGPPTENDARTRTGNQWLKDNPLPAALKQNLEARSGKGNELALFHCSTHLSYIVHLSNFPVGKERTGVMKRRELNPLPPHLREALYQLSYAPR